jgi:hypothetical protein
MLGLLSKQDATADKAQENIFRIVERINHPDYISLANSRCMRDGNGVTSSLPRLEWSSLHACWGLRWIE